MLVRQKNSTQGGATLNVADAQPYLDSGNYDVVNDGSTSGSNLTGTLPPERTLPSGAGGAPTENRLLPTQDGSLQNFKNVLQNITRVAYGNGPKASDVLASYSNAGLPITTPQAIGQALGSETSSRAGRIGDIFQQTVGLINEQETARKEQEARNAQWAQQLLSIMPKSVFGSLTPEEFAAIRTGTPSDTLIQKIQTAIKSDQTIASQHDAQFIQGTENQQSGIFQNGVFTPIASTPSPTSDTGASKVIAAPDGKSYDFRTYATDPNWGNAVNAKLSNIGKFNSINDVQNYISTNFPNSPITAQMVAATSEKYHLPWEIIVAVADHESGLGTLGAGAKTFNPGNVGNVDSGARKNMGTWQAGLDAMGANIADRTISAEQAQQLSQTPKTQEAQIAESIFSGTSNLRIVDLPTKQRSAVDVELNKLKQGAIKSGNIDGIIRASAGGKDTDATFNQSLEKAFNVVAQLGELQKSINDESTGPILGIIRSNNPYDTKAQLIQAQLTALVPNLARGVYGEVGVLTDNDIALYSKTLPNLKSTEDVRKVILGATVRSVQRSIENKLKVQAGLGRDVSGILPTYNDIRTLADQLSGSIVVSQGTKLPPPAK